MLINPGPNRKDIGIKNNILRREPDFLHQQIVAALADLDLAFKRIGLSLFVEGHHHHGSTITLNQTGLFKKASLAFLKRNGIYNPLPLQTTKTSFQHTPFRGIHHHRDPGNIRFRSDQI